MEPEILFDNIGGVGVVTLNRPKALNALTLDMLRPMDHKMQEWEADDSIHAVIIKGAGEKAFCAGGDVRQVWDVCQTDDPLKDEFFREEYVLNRRIHLFPKPYIALLDGIVMGGGVGVSVHGSHRIVTEKSMFAMPETGIGLFPDVGGSWFLNDCPGEVGMYLALTNSRLKAADMIATNMATDFVPTADISALEAAITSADWGSDKASVVIDKILAGFATDAGAITITDHFEEIDRCFGLATAEEMLKALDAESSEFSDKAAKFIRGKSPTTTKVSIKQLRDGKDLSFDECMIMEFRLSQACVSGNDFYEGVRSVLVDKDGAPKWLPARLEDVSEDIVNAHFKSLGPNDLVY